jgi:hypothetical protein
MGLESEFNCLQTAKIRALNAALQVNELKNKGTKQVSLNGLTNLIDFFIEALDGIEVSMDALEEKVSSQSKQIDGLLDYVNQGSVREEVSI